LSANVNIARAAARGWADQSLAPKHPGFHRHFRALPGFFGRRKARKSRCFAARQRKIRNRSRGGIRFSRSTMSKSIAAGPQDAAGIEDPEKSGPMRTQEHLVNNVKRVFRHAREAY